MDWRQSAKITGVNLARVVLGVTFILSGFVKAVDPLGTQYKLTDYLAALDLAGILPDWTLLVASVALSTMEFALGAFILAAIQRRLVSRLALLLMTVMTALTVWIFVADPVQDCGCFGDAIVLTNGETLMKNIVLLACAVTITLFPKDIRRMLPPGVQWMFIHTTVIALLCLSAWCLYDLPILDFRPYHVGADIRKGMEMPEDAEQPEYETTFILEKDGRQQEFTLDDYPDSTWTFVDSKTVTIREGYVPPIHDFSITTEDGDDITDMVLSDKGFTFLLISPTLALADDSNFGAIDELYEYAQDHGCQFYCLTSSSAQDINHWKDITGAEYAFCQTDATTLKTIIRSNPGVVLIKHGVVIGKWSHNFLPDEEELRGLGI